MQSVFFQVSDVPRFIHAYGLVAHTDTYAMASHTIRFINSYAAAPHTIRWHWVKGHNGHPLNERCDELATAAADGNQLIADPGVSER